MITPNPDTYLREGIQFAIEQLTLHRIRIQNWPSGAIDVEVYLRQLLKEDPRDDRLHVLELRISQLELARQERALAEAEDETLLTVDMEVVYDMIAQRLSAGGG